MQDRTLKGDQKREVPTQTSDASLGPNLLGLMEQVRSTRVIALQGLQSPQGDEFYLEPLPQQGSHRDPHIKPFTASEVQPRNQFGVLTLVYPGLTLYHRSYDNKNVWTLVQKKASVSSAQKDAKS